MLQQLSVFLLVRGPKLNTVLEVQPHQCRVQGHDHLPTPAGHTVPDTSQDASWPPGHTTGSCSASHQPTSPGPFLPGSFPATPPQALHGVVVTQAQDLALGLVEPHTASLSHQSSLSRSLCKGRKSSPFIL